MKSTLLVLMVIFAGCATPTAAIPARYVSLSIDVTVDGDGYSGEDLAADLFEASKVWNSLGGFAVLDDAAPAALRCATWSMDTAAATTNSSGISVDCLYVVNLPVEAKKHILAHELGHMFGLLHVQDPEALMFPSTSRDSRNIITKADIDEFFSVDITQ
jgi:hypothetical protein